MNERTYTHDVAPPPAKPGVRQDDPPLRGKKPEPMSIGQKPQPDSRSDGEHRDVPTRPRRGPPSATKGGEARLAKRREANQRKKAQIKKVRAQQRARAK